MRRGPCKLTANRGRPTVGATLRTPCIVDFVTTFSQPDVPFPFTDVKWSLKTAGLPWKRVNLVLSSLHPVSQTVHYLTMYNLQASSQSIACSSRTSHALPRHIILIPLDLLTCVNKVGAHLSYRNVKKQLFVAACALSLPSNGLELNGLNLRTRLLRLRLRQY